MIFIKKLNLSMRIKEVKLNNIRSFKDSSVLELCPNTNVIIGMNGSGKSNILSAIKYLFSHNARSSLEERQSFIYEGSHNSELTGVIEIKFENEDGKFPADSEFTIKKEISLKKEEYFLNDKNITKEELNALFESSGLPIDSKYFIVPQGEVDKLSVMSEKERYLLLKEISGALSYEKDKKKFEEQLKETEEMKKKVFIFNEKINQKLEKLRKEQRKLILVEKLDEEKNLIERILLERELENVNLEIKELQNQFVEIEDNYQSKLLELRIKLKELKEQKMQCYDFLKTEQNFDLEKENLLNVDLQDLLIKNNHNEIRKRAEVFIKDLKEIRDFEKKEEENLKRYEKELEDLKITVLAKEMENLFLKNNLNISLFTNEEKEEVRKEINELEEILNNEEEFTEEFDEKKYEKCISERKKAWIEENNLENKLKRLQEEIKKIENVILINFGISEQIIKEIKEHSGVHGCVFELFNIPEELYVPASAVISKNFFNIVVENEDVATDLFKFINNRITFIALNRIKNKEEKMIDDENMIPLWEQIVTEEKYKELLKYLTHNTYLVSDINNAILKKKKHNVNIVTLEGELVFKNGIITGGYEEKKNIFVEFKFLQKELNRAKEEKKELTRKINLLNDAINTMQRRKNEIKEKEDFYVLKAKLIFLKKKINLMNKILLEKDVKNNSFELENLKVKNTRLQMEKENAQCRLLEIKEKLKQLEKQEENYKQKLKSFEIKNKLQLIENEIKEIKEEEKKLIFKISDTPLETENNKKISNLKSVLIEKRNKIFQKISSLHVQKDYKKSKYFDMNEEKIAEELKKLSERKNEHKGINYKASIQLKEMEMHQNDLTNRMDELDISKREIESFLEELDLKKETIIDSTFNLISESFKYFLEKLSTNLNISLLKENDSLFLLNDGIKVSSYSLSGGQRAIIALSFIFAVQRIDPAPFYIFDEIDANLDKDTRIKLTNLINNINDYMNTQFIFTTFKNELLECGKKFFNVNFKDKRSFVKECQNNEAVEFIFNKN